MPFGQLGNLFRKGAENWKAGGGIDGLMANPWFQMGQSMSQGQGVTPGYVQSQQIRSMQEEQKRREAMMMAMRGLSTGSPSGPMAPQAPKRIEDMIAGGIGAQAAGMGQYGTSAQMVPQINPVNPTQPQPGNAPAPSAAAPVSAGDRYRRMLEAMAMYGDGAQQIEAMKELVEMSAPASSGFAGNGMEAQAINTYLNSLPPEIRHQEMLRIAQQRMTQPRTITTPEGTYTIPGYTIPGFPGSADGSGPSTGAGGVPSGFTPKPISEGEARDQYVGNSLLNVSNMLNDFEAQNPEFDPTAFEHYIKDVMVPGSGLENMVRDSGKQTHDALRKEWAANLVFLRSGVTAREEEVEREMSTSWPQAGDSEETKMWKRRLRAEKELEAYNKGFREGRVHPDEYEVNKAKLEERVQAARDALRAAGAKPWEMQW